MIICCSATVFKLETLKLETLLNSPYKNTITMKHKQNNRWRGDLMKPLGLSSEVTSRNKQYMYIELAYVHDG